MTSIKVTTTPNFSLSIEQLQDLMKHQGAKSIKKLKEFGGIEKLCNELYTSPDNGITSNKNSLDYRELYYGKNIIQPPKSKTFFELIIVAFQDPILIFLEIGGVFTIFIAIFEKFLSSREDHNSYEWIEGIAIIISVVIIVLVTAITDYEKEKQFRHLQDDLKREHKIPVIRDGEIIDIATKFLLVGDICLINYGNLIPADGIIIQSNDLKIDESSLTGESDLVIKDIEIDISVLSGTYVMEGSGKIVITAVGKYSQNGIILQLLGMGETHESPRVSTVVDDKNQQVSNAVNTIADLRQNKTTEKNPDKIRTGKIDTTKNKSILQIKLLTLAYKISKAAIIITIVLIIVLLIQFVYRFITQNQKWDAECLHILVSYILTGVSILAIAIPEGLPLAVTLALAYSVKKMTYDNNLVRNLAACETMGNATIICSDKTGTLTTNRMTCVELFLCEKLFKKIPKFERMPQACAKLIIEGISVNSLYTSRIIMPNETIKVMEQIGNKTECALLGLVNSLGKNYESIRQKYPENEFIQIYTFNSVRKSMSTVIKKNNFNYRLYTKGASEIIMEKCRYIFTLNGEVELFTDEMKTNLNKKVILPMARDGLRTITVAYRDFLSKQSGKLNDTIIELNTINWSKEDTIVKDLTFLCVCGIEDPVRPEVPHAIHLCQMAGITIRMVTGDNIVTAKSIAMKCGIINSDTINNSNVIMEGHEFNRICFDSNGIFNQKQFDKIWPKLRVLARSAPIDKYVLVKGIIDSKITKHREIVAVTGDGTNDAPALKIADVGFAMGIAGTDVAKEASDIIITDDNFSSIVKAVMWGRNIYDSIAKFIQFQLTVNLVAVIIAVSSAVASSSSALKAVQLLWVNLIMDSLASLALATEKPTEKILSRKPYGRLKSIISGQMLVNIFCQAIYQLIVLYTVLFYFDKLLDIPSGKLSQLPSAHYTLVFNLLVVMTLFNEFNARKLHGEWNVFEGILSNYIFIIIWVTTLIIQIIIVQFGGVIFHTKSLTFNQWLICLLFGFGTLLWKYLYNRLPIEIYAKSIYYVIFPPYHQLMDQYEKHNKDSDSETKQWIGSSKRLSTQLDVLRRLSINSDVENITKIIQQDPQQSQKK